MRVPTYALVLGILLILAQCNPVTEPTGSEQIPVVEGYLFSDESVQQIRLSLMIPLTASDTIPEPVNDAEVVVKHQGERYPFNLAPGDSGVYRYTGSDFTVFPGDTFELEVEMNSGNISSKTGVPPAPDSVKVSSDVVYVNSDLSFFELVQNLPEPEITWHNPGDRYYYVLVENIEEHPQPIIDSENAPGFNGGPFGGAFSFRTTPTNGDSYSVDLRGGYYGKHRVTVYSVNRDYVNLYEEREQDSRRLNEPPSNITNGLGIFTSFSSDSTFFWVLEK
ncbi:MAG: DUF4249 family protein [Balneolaceae bacterium]|nr:DUF4249 family protein [Balneolaceae bacterium]